MRICYPTSKALTAAGAAGLLGATSVLFAAPAYRTAAAKHAIIGTHTAPRASRIRSRVVPLHPAAKHIPAGQMRNTKPVAVHLFSSALVGVHRDLIPADEIIPLSKIHPGMEGYGLTVFHGYKVERFGVKVIDILHKQYMGRDLILIRMSGGPITSRGANIIAGMSGSPVYFGGKLAGAVSMGYEWPKEPVAMVTPIEYMQEAFNPRLPSKPQFSSVPWSQQQAQFFSQGFAGMTVENSSHTEQLWRDRFSQAASFFGAGSAFGPGSAFGTEGGLHPLMTPIFTSGLSPQVVSGLSHVLAPLGMRAVAGMGAGNDSPAASQASMVPGSMVGVFFCTGDVELGGFGTVTYRKGNRILAFGHPMQQLGPIDFPLSTSYVADVFAGYPRSEKMCLPGKLVGSLQQDRPFSVMGTIGRPAHVVPLTIAVDDESTGASRTFHIQCADHPLLTSLIADVAAQEAISEVRSFPGDSMVNVRVEVDPHGLAPIVRDNTYFDYFSPGGFGEPSLADMDHILDLLQSNPFRAVGIGAIKVSMHIHSGRKMSSIERIAINKSQVAPGDKIHVDVALRPYKGTPYIVPLDVQIPADAPNGAATLLVTGGMLSPTPSLPGAGGGFTIVIGGGGGRSSADPAANLEELIDRFLKTDKNTDLVGRVVQSASPSLNINGERLYNLPPALSAALHSPRSTGSSPLPDEAKTVKPMSEMILGAQGVPINIQREDNNEQPVENHPSATPVIKHAPPDIPVPTPKTPANGAATTLSALEDALASGPGAAPIHQASEEGGAAGGDGMIVPPTGTSAQPTVTTTTKTTVTSTDATAATPTPAATAETTPEGVAKKLQTWTLRTQADFDAGHGDGVAVGSLGDLSIAPQFRRLHSLEKDDFVWVIRPGSHNSMLVGTGNNGLVYREDEGHNLTTALKTNELDVLSLALAPDGSTYAGTAPHGLIYRIPAIGSASAATPFFKTGKQYVLALTTDNANNLFAGTNGGAIYKVSSNGTGALWYQSKEAHICALDTAPNGDILAGTSPSGLVYRITPDGKASVIWDSGDESVSSIAAFPNGDILAATAPKGTVSRMHGDGSDAVQVLKTDVSIHDLCRSGSDVFAASGPALYQILPTNEVRKIQNEDNQDVLTVGAEPNGDLLAGTGSLAGVYRVTRQVNNNIYRTSIKDASSISSWGHVRWTGDLPAGSIIAWESRAGNSDLPDTTWSAWTPVTPDSDGAAVNSPQARFIQLRSLLSSSPDGASPIIRSVSLTYMPENRPPTLTIASPAAGAVLHGKTDISWTGQDPDGDALVYSVAASPDGGLTWKNVSLVDKEGKPVTTDIISDSYQWDTSALRDGSYLLKVTVSDRRSNANNAMQAAQLAGPFRVVNSPLQMVVPALSVHTAPDGSISFTGTADGKGSAIVAVSYRVDGGAWFAAAPDNGFFDSQQVGFKVQTGPLGSGDHKIEVQATSASGDKTLITVPLKSSATPATTKPGYGAPTTKPAGA